MRLLALGAGLPAVIAALVLLWIADYTPKVQWTLTVADPGDLVGLRFGHTRAGGVSAAHAGEPARSHARRRLLDSRPRHGRHEAEDALADVMHQVNAMSATLRAQRLGALEATTLLRKVMEEIDVAVFAFDGEQRLRLVNRAGERLLKQPAERILHVQRRSPGPGRIPGRRAGANRPAHVPAGRRPLGHDAFDVPRRRPAAPAVGGQRSDARAARRGTEGLAETGARAGPRAEQFSGADQIHRREPGIAGGARASPRGLARRRAPRSFDHRRAQRGAQPFSGSLRAAGQIAASAPRCRGGGNVDPPVGDARAAHDRPRCGPVRR